MGSVISLFFCLLMASLNLAAYFGFGHHWFSLVAAGFCFAMGLVPILFFGDR